MTEADRDAPNLDAGSFERLLLDLDVPDEDLRPYLVQNESDSDPFCPVVTANPARVKAPETEAAVALSSLNGIARWRRQQRYRRKLPSWTGLRVVSEGDSWFQYPFLLKDVIDWLSASHAIYGLDAAGDLLSDMVQQSELVTAVIQEKPDVVVLSGGGNDLLGGSRLSQAVLAFEEGRTAQDYLGAPFEANLQAALSDYERLFARLAEVAPDTPVLCHVYDYAIPARGRWLGRPLAELGIADPRLQREIVRAIVDRFHAALTRLAERFARVRVIDTRGAVGDARWHDELHPNDPGYAAVARLFAAEIAQVTGTDVPELATEAAVVEGVALEAPDEAERLLALLDAYSDDALLREIGRREALARAGDPQPEPVAVYPSSVVAAFPQLRDDGLRVLAAAGEEAFAEREPGHAKLEQVLRGSRAALVQHLASVLTTSGQREDQAILSAALFARHSDGDIQALRRRWAALLEPQ
jgi:lysophospholipase L1-like esterase